jgi:hypothetical protein
MNKLMSSLIAATIVGTFSLSAIAADVPAAATTAEKPAAAPQKAHSTKKHTSHTAAKKPDAAAMPAEPAAK